MKKLFIIILLFISARSMAQSSSSVQVNGNIDMPLLQTVKVEIANRQPISFKTPDEIDNGIVIPGYYKITVISNVPWVISVMSNTAKFQSMSLDRAGSKEAPSSDMLEVKNSTGTFIPIGISPQTIMVNQTNNIVTEFYIDIRVKPGVLINGGNYSSGLIFTISEQ